MPEKKLILLRTSERSTFRTCRQQWWWGYEDQLSSTQPKKALSFGTMIHEALQGWYKPGKKRGRNPAKAFGEIYEKYLFEGGQPLMMGPKWSPPDAGTLGVSMMEEYVRHYGRDERYRIIQPEQSFQLDVHHPKTGKYLFTYVSQMDAVIQDLNTGEYGLFEHKTSSSTDPFGAPLTLDEQASSYWTFGYMWLKASGKIPADMELEFMLYNFMRKALPDRRPEDEQGRKLNKDGSVSKNQPAEYFRREKVYRGDAERRACYRRAVQDFREMEMVRNGKLKVVKTFGKHCGFCQFKDMCEVHETGSDWKAMRDNLFTKWDPYEDHEGDLADAG